MQDTPPSSGSSASFGNCLGLNASPAVWDTFTDNSCLGSSTICPASYVLPSVHVGNFHLHLLH